MDTWIYPCPDQKYIIKNMIYNDFSYLLILMTDIVPFYKKEEIIFIFFSALKKLNSNLLQIRFFFNLEL